MPVTTNPTERVYAEIDREVEAVLALPAEDQRMAIERLFDRIPELAEKERRERRESHRT